MAEHFWLQPESRRLEFKEGWPGGDKIARTAFANGAGGRIVFGVRNNPREIIGLSDKALFDLEERVSNHIYDMCAPAIVPEVFIQDVDGRALLVVEIYPGPQKPYHLETAGRTDGTYVRVGSVNRKASQDVMGAIPRPLRSCCPKVPSRSVPFPTPKLNAHASKGWRPRSSSTRRPSMVPCTRALSRASPLSNGTSPWAHRWEKCTARTVGSIPWRRFGKP